MSPKKLNKKNRIIIASFAFVLVIFILFSTRQFLMAQLTKHALLPLPEKYTELYFDNSAHLPITNDGTKPEAFTFAIHNVEDENRTYSYAISVIAGTKSRIIDSGSVYVKNSQILTVNEKFNLIYPDTWQEVVITLVDKKQSIHFWIKKD